MTLTLFIIFDEGDDAVYPIPVGGNFHWNNVEGAKIKSMAIITNAMIETQPDALPTGENHI